ncbi:MAG TPA: NAD(P)/FAD-dependent oxidoreductase, partial [Rhodanobacteraceae bacterium]|nr:NAD(P)/FAD-dependent oxidoreductase [Rhodanobacteraceae bacterium]
MDASAPDTLIVGAGPAGLAVGAALRRAGVPFDIVERGDTVGASWRRHYDRLHLHTPKQQSSLPFLPFPASAPRYPSRDEVVAYLDDYAKTFDLAPELGVDVEHCERGDDRWHVRTNRGVRHARHLVVATGFSRVPRRVSWPGLDTFAGPVLHSSAYASGERFRGQRVLVVGFGNSGAEIALDLAECGAESTVSVRGAVNVVPRDILGVPITYLGRAGRVLPLAIADRINATLVRLVVGNLARFGLRKRDDGPLAEIVRTRQIPVVDVGTLAAIRQGRITVRPAIESSMHEAVRFADGRVETFHAIVLATGYETGLDAIFGEAAATLLDEAKRPRTSG